MAKHEVYQIKKTNRRLASESVFYGISDAFTQATAKQAFRDGYYSHTADVEAANNKGVADLVNNDRTSAKINSLGPLRNISVGDLIHNVESDRWFITSSSGYDPISIRFRSNR